MLLTKIQISTKTSEASFYVMKIFMKSKISRTHFLIFVLLNFSDKHYKFLVNLTENNFSVVTIAKSWRIINQYSRS